MSQSHHISYEPEITVDTKKEEHIKIHGHGTGICKGDKLRHRKYRQICITKANKVHFPKIIREQLELKSRVAFTIGGGGLSVVLFNPNTPAETIIKSIDILREDLKLRLKEKGK